MDADSVDRGITMKTFPSAFAVLAFLFIPFSVAHAQSFQQNPSNKHYYAVTPIKMTWKAAQAMAKQVGGNLATVRSKAENDWIWQSYGAKGGLFIGASDEVKEGSWKWRGGEALRYANWAPGEPNNYGNTEHYAQMWGLPLGPNGTWNDCSGTALSHAVFEWIQAPLPASCLFFGAGCAASNHKTALVYAKSPPVIGVGFEIGLHDALPQAPTVLTLGFSLSPIDLAGLGAPGCKLWSEPRVILPISTNKTGNWPHPVVIPIPFRGDLVGGTLLCQVVILDKKANAFGAVVSNGLVAILGF